MVECVLSIYRPIFIKRKKCLGGGMKEDDRGGEFNYDIL
jgi:hypothetical protein